jgi:uncharacterized membrane protein
MEQSPRRRAKRWRRSGSYCALVDFSDWLLALHVLAAFALVGALVLFSAVMVAGWAVDQPQRAVAYSRLAAVGGMLVGPGAGLALLLGIALAIDIDAYQVWDGWILVSIALWIIGAATGSRVGTHYADARELAQRLADGADGRSSELAAKLSDRRVAALHVITVAAFTIILVLMIFKPGA